MKVFANKDLESEFENSTDLLKYCFDHFVMLSLSMGVIPKISRIKNHPFESAHLDGRAIDVAIENSLGGAILYNPNQIQKIMWEMQIRFPGIICLASSSQNYKEKFGKRAAMHFHIEIPGVWDEKKLKEFSHSNPQ